MIDVLTHLASLQVFRPCFTNSKLFLSEMSTFHKCSEVLVTLNETGKSGNTQDFSESKLHMGGVNPKFPEGLFTRPLFTGVLNEQRILPYLLHKLRLVMRKRLPSIFRNFTFNFWTKKTFVMTSLSCIRRDFELHNPHTNTQTHTNTHTLKDNFW